MAIKLSIKNILPYLKRSVILAISGLVVIIVYIFYLSQDLPSLDQLENYDPDLVTRIYSMDGKILDELYLEKRIFVGLDDIPNNMKNAVIASEVDDFIIIGVLIHEVFCGRLWSILLV